MLGRPNESEYDRFYAGYISLVPNDDVLLILEEQKSRLNRIAGTIAADRETYRYEPQKWSIREVIGHIVDAERVFGFRAFCFSRGERSSLPGFDEKDYVARSRFHELPLREMAEEFSLVRSSNLAVFRRLNPEEWMRIGTANNAPVSVRALAFIAAGHFDHHLRVLRERYGVTG